MSDLSMHRAPESPMGIGPAPLAVSGARSDAEQAVSDFIAARLNFERLPAEQYGLQDFKLERMRSLLRRLGDPQEGLPAVHIAGTKGKGSTAAMTASMLRAAGHRVGLFTSPHIEHYSERMIVNGQRPTTSELMDILDEIRPAVAEMDAIDASMQPTFFEVLTAMAWLHFRTQQADIVVLETGLGGRLDATNVCSPLVCLITSISRDHERLLGSTLAEIAREKAGIIKPGVPVISAVLEESPRRVIADAADHQCAPLMELDRNLHWSQSDGRDDDESGLRKLRIDVTTPWRSHSSLAVPLAGEHQARNLALALAAVDLLDATQLEVSHEAVTSGLSNMSWPLRTEIVGREPLVLVDAAHNVASIDALLKTLEPVKADMRVLVFATSKDKDTAGMLARIGDHFDRAILTQLVNNPRAVSRTSLELAAATLTTPWEWADSPAEAWLMAAQMTTPASFVCATGSFFLAVEFRRVIQQHVGAKITEMSPA